MTNATTLADEYMIARYGYGSATCKPRRPMAQALEIARRKAGRFPHVSRRPHKFGTPGNATFEAHGMTCRYLEADTLSGFRDCGWCDEILSGLSRDYNHRGWFTNEFGDGDRYRGVVHQIPSRNGRACYMSGYRSVDHRGRASGDDGALVEMTIICADDASEDAADAARIEAAKSANEIARIFAEHEMERSHAWNAMTTAREKLDDARHALVEYYLCERSLRRAGLVNPRQFEDACNATDFAREERDEAMAAWREACRDGARYDISPSEIG